MKWRPWEARLVRGKEMPATGETNPGREAPEAGSRMQRAARRLRLSVCGSRNDLGDTKHRRRWLAWELAD